MNITFGIIGDTYVAIHHDENKVFLCRDDKKNLEAKVWIGKKEVDNVASYTSIKKIDEKTFVDKFSAVVEKLHSNTPYA